MSISGTADAEFKSGTEVRLAPGFHAGGMSGNGRFHGWIDTGLGADGDVVTIAPDPATHEADNVLHVNKWEKLEIGIRLPQVYQDAIERFFTAYYPNGPQNNTADPGNTDPVHDLNPYADDSLQLVMTLTRPDGTQTLKWGFFMKESTWASPDPTAVLTEATDDPLYPYHIRFRIAPDAEGPWQFNLSIKAPYTTSLSDATLEDLNYTGYGFLCDPPLPDNRGPLHVNTENRRTLQFEDGTSFFGLGTNLADKTDNDTHYLEMQKIMDELHSVGGNFVRMFMLRNVFAPEWVNLGVYDRFKTPPICLGNTLVYSGSCQYQCWAFDQMVEHAREKDLYIQLCVDPYPPILAYQTNIWGAHAYVLNFLEPAREVTTGRYNTKGFFFSDGSTTNTGFGVFYYWKRKYKYIIARWGYSVNIPIIEPFNEVDQMLGYGDKDLTVTPGDQQYDICPDNRLVWPAIPGLPAVYSAWLSDIIHFVKDPVDFSNPVVSPLGENDKLFLAGTGPQSADNPDYNHPDNPDWNLPNTNPNVDLIDVHHGMYWGDAELANSFDVSTTIREAYTANVGGITYKRPFHQGEFNYYALKDFDGNPSNGLEDSGQIFDNYDVSLHNEIWASTFFGNFATGTTWQWPRVFWLSNLPTPPFDASNPFYQQYPRTNALGATNALYIDNPATPTLVNNRTVYHNFKPLSDLLFGPDLQSYGFFNEDFTPHHVEENGLECYYLVSGVIAVGWVHNLNAYWENHYYVKHDDQNFLGCISPALPQSISLPGFFQDHGFLIMWYPTRMNGIAPTAANTVSSLAGEVTLDLSADPLHGIVNNYLDTLHSDYAFIISPAPEHRSMTISDGSDTLGSNWDFSLYPNPADNQMNVLLPSETPTDITIYDLSGRRVSSWGSVSGTLVRLSIDKLSRGVYSVRASDGRHTKVKELIIR